jgi:hypothetical protein
MALKEGAGRAQHEIEVFYPPSYSPQLNTNELANADLKQAVTKLAPAWTNLQLVKATAKHLRSVQRQPQRIKSYFQHEPARYAPDSSWFMLDQYSQASIFQNFPDSAARLVFSLAAD